MTAMGFPTKLSKQALVKVKNESAAAAVEALMDLQATEAKKKPAPAKAIITIGKYSCTLCTFENAAGKAVCEICGEAAPQTAYIIVKSEDELKKEKDEAERKEKERLDEAARIEKDKAEESKRKEDEDRERLEKLEQEERDTKLACEIIANSKEYFANA
jgi:uncharacterized Zn finger protein (UPF0148 family)